MYIVKIGDRLMIPPVLAEAVRLAGLPGVAVPVRAVLPLHERRVDRPADALDIPKAAITAAIVPKTTRVTIFTTRPFSRVFSTTA